MEKNSLSSVRCVFLMLIQLITFNCWADLSDLKVYSPIVEKGKIKRELFNSKAEVLEVTLSP